MSATVTSHPRDLLLGCLRWEKRCQPWKSLRDEQRALDLLS